MRPRNCSRPRTRDPLEVMDMFPKGKNRSGKWTYERIKQLLDLLAQYGGSLSNKELAQELDVSVSALSSMMRELRRARKEGYTLDEYVEAGRPLRQGNRIAYDRNEEEKR